MRPPFTDDDLRHLAVRILAVRADGVEDWLEWEDYPELGQYEFERLTERVQEEAKRLRSWSRFLDWGKDIDSAHLMEMTQG